MKFLVPSMIACGIAAVLSGCVPASPAARIDRNPEAYRALSPEHREEVRDGKISRGMSYDAVALAWGRPARELEIIRPDGSAVRWDYVGTRPVFDHHFYGGYGRGRYDDSCGRNFRRAFAYGPEVVYVPYHRASVWFVDGKVDAWESVR